MSGLWAPVAAVAAIVAATKAAGPLLIGRRDLPAWALRVVALLPAALLSALIVVETLSVGRELVLDARAAGVGATGVALALRAPLLVAIGVAPVVTALLRAVA